MLVPAAAIGALSLLLVVGLEVLNLMGAVDGMISKLVSQGAVRSFPKALPEWLVWLVTLVPAFGLPLAILSVAGVWRRCVLWITALVLMAGWAPVLALAAHFPDVGAPVIATLWSGVCAMVYAGSHRMAGEGTTDQPS
ncbi:MAG: hypothetical protein ACRCXD_04575 [Luteolibacter sp.]